MYCGLTIQKPQNQSPAPLPFFSSGLVISGEELEGIIHKTIYDRKLFDHVIVVLYDLKDKFPFVGTDCRMQVVLHYCGHRVMKVTTRSPDGCFIMQGSVPLGNERIYGPCTAQQLSFPSPSSINLGSYMTEAMSRLLCHLERGVLLWVAPDGMFIKRFCQGRVYWSGPTAQHKERPNKLEREKTFKLLDIPTFINGKLVYAWV